MTGSVAGHALSDTLLPSPAGNTVAKIVSPIVSVLVVTLVGAAAGYCQRNRRRNCFTPNGKFQGL